MHTPRPFILGVEKFEKLAKVKRLRSASFSFEKKTQHRPKIKIKQAAPEHFREDRRRPQPPRSAGRRWKEEEGFPDCRKRKSSPAAAPSPETPTHRYDAPAREGGLHTCFGTDRHKREIVPSVNSALLPPDARPAARPPNTPLPSAPSHHHITPAQKCSRRT